MFNRQWFTGIKTPCFIYDIECLVKRIERIRAAFHGTSYAQYYPLKANPNPGIVSCCLDNGLGIDACSPGDLEIAGIFDLQPGNISFTGIGLSEKDMRSLYERGIVPNLSSTEQVKRWAKLFPCSQIGLRVSILTPGRKQGNHYSLKMGIWPGDWPDVQEIVRSNHLQVIRLHCHESRNSLAAKELVHDFSVAFESIPSWAWENVGAVNFGGGWGLPHLRQGELDVEKLVRGMTEIVRDIEKSFAARKLTIEIEPGEFLVGECGYLLTKVVDVRILTSQPMGKKFQVVILDTPFPATSGSRRPELLYHVGIEPNDEQKGNEALFTIVYGRSNTSMDTINKGMYLPAVNVGNTVLIPGVGAYIPVLLSHFNEQDMPAEFLLKGDRLEKSRDCLKFGDYYRREYRKERRLK